MVEEQRRSQRGGVAVEAARRKTRKNVGGELAVGGGRW